MSLVHGEHMELLGTGNTMRLAKRANRLQFRRIAEAREQLYRDELPTLLKENGGTTLPPITLADGWHLDRSGTLPHLDQLITEAGQIIAERGMRPKKAGEAERSFFQSIQKPDDFTKYPSILNFALSSDVLSAVCRYMQTIPVLSRTFPQGVRLAESSITFDARPQDGYRSSQLYHLDHHDTPMVYVIVLLKDVTERCGPFTFLSDSVSTRAAAAMRYQTRAVDYRVDDETMYRHVARSEAQVMALPQGTVLFLDSSRCFHYGSRDAYDPRYQMMYAYTSVCRTDFSEWFTNTRGFPRGAHDSRLRRLVLDKYAAG